MSLIFKLIFIFVLLVNCAITTYIVQNRDKLDN